MVVLLGGFVPKGLFFSGELCYSVLKDVVGGLDGSDLVVLFLALGRRSVTVAVVRQVLSMLGGCVLFKKFFGVFKSCLKLIFYLYILLFGCVFFDTPSFSCLLVGQNFKRSVDL